MRKPYVAEELLEPARATRVARFFFIEGDVPELATGGFSRGGRRHAAPNVLGGLTLDVVLELVVELAVDDVSAED